MWGEGKKVSKCTKVQKSVKLKRDVFLTENLLQLANFTTCKLSRVIQRRDQAIALYDETGFQT